MKIHNMPRDSGKTTMMIKWLEQDDQRVLLVSSVQERRMLQEAHPAVKGQIFTAGEWNFKRVYWSDSTEIGIDEVPLVLRRQYGNVTKITLSCNEEY